jgi:hypothetical protein
MHEKRERELLLEQVRAWIATKDMTDICRSPEVTELIYQLEREHHAYPQVIVNVNEN